MNQRVVVGMSGGVDSSVAALLLRDSGYDVIGATMSIYSGKSSDSPVPDACYGPGEHLDIEEAQKICAQLGIPHEIIDLKSEYRSIVLDYTRSEYLAGRTPNPCVLCNQKVKFGMLVSRLASHNDFDFFATGHYCRVVKMLGTGRYAIQAAVSTAKDQSYFLCMLDQQQLGRVLFPLGELDKTQVREIAKNAGLPNYSRPDSQDFVSGSYQDAMEFSKSPGNIIRDGEIIGRHEGVWNYTIGQRKGLGIGGRDTLYVIDIDPIANTVIVGTESQLLGNELFVKSVNWSAISEPRDSVRFGVKVRYRGLPEMATIFPERGSARVVFDKPSRAITPGQWAVFYDKDILIGGGMIDIRR